MDPPCSLAHPPPPPPPRAAQASPPLPRRTTGLANLLNATPSSSSSSSQAAASSSKNRPFPSAPPTPPPTAPTLAEPLRASGSADPWTSFFPQLPQTRRRRAPANTRTKSDPDVNRARADKARTPSPYSRNKSDPSPGPYSQHLAPQTVQLPQSLPSWGRQASFESPHPAETSLFEPPQAIGWSAGGGEEGRKRKRASAEQDDVPAVLQGVPIADASKPGAELAPSGPTFFRQVALRRAVGEEPILYVADTQSSAELYPPPPARPVAPAYHPSSTPLKSTSELRSVRRASPSSRSSPPDVAGPALESPEYPAEHPRYCVEAEAMSRSLSRYSGSPDSNSSLTLSQVEPARAADRDNSLRMSGVSVPDAPHQRRPSGYHPVRYEDEAARKLSYSVDPLTVVPAGRQPWYPPPPPSAVIHHHHHHVYSTSTRSDSVSSLVFDEASARSSISSQGPSTVRVTPVLDANPSPPGSPAWYRQSSLAGRGKSSAYPGTSPDAPYHVPPRHTQHHSVQLPLVSTSATARNESRRAAKRRRAGSLSQASIYVTQTVAPTPAEPRRSSTPVDRSMGIDVGRSAHVGYERYLDTTPRAGGYDLLRRASQIPADYARFKSSLLQTAPDLHHFSPVDSAPSSSLQPRRTLPRLFGERSASRTPTGSPRPGSSGSVLYGLSDDGMSSHGTHSPHMGTPRPAPFSGTKRIFTLGSPTKPRTDHLQETHVRTPTATTAAPPSLPSMWLPPFGEANRDAQQGRHLRLPSLTEALRDLEVREAGRR